MITDADRAKAREICDEYREMGALSRGTGIDDRIATALAAARDEALERAAKKCDAKRHLASGDFKIIPSELAQEIRALKVEAPADPREAWGRSDL